MVITSTKQNTSEGDFMNNKNSYQIPNEAGVINVTGTTLGKGITGNKEKLLLEEQ